MEEIFLGQWEHSHPSSSSGDLTSVKSAKNKNACGITWQRPVITCEDNPLCHGVRNSLIHTGAICEYRNIYIYIYIRSQGIQSPSENGVMDLQYFAEEVINIDYTALAHHLTFGEPGFLGHYMYSYI